VAFRTVANHRPYGDAGGGSPNLPAEDMHLGLLCLMVEVPAL